MFTTAFRDTTLTQLVTLGTHIGLLTAITDFRAGTVTEASYTGYARAAITWGTATNTTPAGGRQRANSALVTFPQNTGANQDVLGWGVYSASAAGTLQAIGFLDSDPPIMGTVSAATDLITAYVHGLQTDQRVFMLAAPAGSAPDVFAENTAYFVLAAGLTADLFALSATSGGAAINATISGVAWFMSYKAQTVATNSTPEFAIGALLVQV